MTALLMGIDVGTFETKGVLVDTNGRVRAEARVRHGISTPQPGWVEQDADEVWWRDLAQVARELSAHITERDALLGLACSAIGPCVLPIDADLRPLRPAILYGIDTRASAEIAELEARLGPDEILRRSGNTLTSQSAGPKILWIERHEPEIAARTRWYVSSQSYLVARLTGRVVLDHATAGYAHPCYDLRELRWNCDGIADLIAPHKLPELAWSSEIAGWVTAEAAAATGLPQGLPVAVGTTDAPAEAFGASVMHPGDVMLMLGSSGFMIQVRDEPVVDEVLWSAPWVMPGQYVLAAGTSAAGTATRWVAEQLDLDRGDGDEALFGRLMQLVRAAPVGCDGIVHLPHFSGERTPFHDAEARGAFVGLALTSGRAHLARAVIEGVAHSVALALSTLVSAGRDRAVPAPQPRVVAVGGGTKNEVLTQSVSELTGLDLEVAKSLGAALGDAMLAGVAVGAVTPTEAAAWVSREATVRPSGDPEIAATLQHAHEVFQASYRALRAARAAGTPNERTTT